jgi:hypothetical protein
MNPEPVFAFPAKRHQRRHGPLGYVDYKSLKPWLRDEFTFRCAYCLWRENWCADGDGSFGVDHLRPPAIPAERRNEANCWENGLLAVLALRKVG